MLHLESWGKWHIDRGSQSKSVLNVDKECKYLCLHNDVCNAVTTTGNTEEVMDSLLGAANVQWSSPTRREAEMAFSSMAH